VGDLSGSSERINRTDCENRSIESILAELGCRQERPACLGPFACDTLTDRSRSYGESRVIAKLVKHLPT
jgi:hypothetical protein